MDAFAHYPRTQAEGTPTARRDQCPRCRTLAAGPRVSSYQPGGVIAHHWQCECCNSGWDTFFQPLLV